MNEAASLPELIDGIKRNIPEEMIYEIIVVNDGSTDNTEEVVCCIAADDSAVHLISHRKNFGKAAALETGFHESTGGIVITMDADLQDHRDSGPVYSFSHWDSSGSHLSKQIIREEIMIVTSETNKNGDIIIVVDEVAENGQIVTEREKKIKAIIRETIEQYLKQNLVLN